MGGGGGWCWGGAGSCSGRGRIEGVLEICPLPSLAAGCFGGGGVKEGYKYNIQQSTNVVLCILDVFVQKTL